MSPNDQDAGRTTVNSIISKRALRESDLLAFQICIERLGRGRVMCSYNRINGRFLREHLYADGCAEERSWVQGICVSDWGATESTAKAALAGLDIEMPGNDSFGRATEKSGGKRRSPDGKGLNDMCIGFCGPSSMRGSSTIHRKPQALNAMDGFKIGAKIEESGAVLLKN